MPNDAVPRPSQQGDVCVNAVSDPNLGFLQKDLRAPDVVIGADTIVVSLAPGPRFPDSRKTSP